VSGTEKKPDPLRGALFLANLAAEGEARRIEGLSDEEFLAGQREKGRDSSQVPTTEELLARVKARAARLEADAGRPPPASDVVDDPAPRSRVIPMRRSSRLVWILAAAAVVIVIIAALNRPENIARPHPGDDNGPLPQPTQHGLAEKLRDDAIGNCQLGAWATCKDMLDHAAELDPAGEMAERVQKARAEIAESTAPAPPKPDKPRP
jgi:hypothetical protein